MVPLQIAGIVKLLFNTGIGFTTTVVDIVAPTQNVGVGPVGVIVKVTV